MILQQLLQSGVGDQGDGDIDFVQLVQIPEVWNARVSEWRNIDFERLDVPELSDRDQCLVRESLSECETQRRQPLQK